MKAQKKIVREVLSLQMEQNKAVSSGNGRKVAEIEKKKQFWLKTSKRQPK